jgi:hypothetical protein
MEISIALCQFCGVSALNPQPTTLQALKVLETILGSYGARYGNGLISQP